MERSNAETTLCLIPFLKINYHLQDAQTVVHSSTCVKTWYLYADLISSSGQHLPLIVHPGEGLDVHPTERKG